MRRNEIFTTTAVGGEPPLADFLTESQSISEYKIGHTTYIVQTQFNVSCDDTLENVLRRLIIRDICAAETVA